MAREDAAALEALKDLVPELVGALRATGQAQRYLHPAFLESLQDALAPFRQRLEEAAQRFRASEWRGELVPLKAPLERAAEHALVALEGFLGDASGPDAVIQRFRALRRQTDAMEALYPLHTLLAPVSRFFLDDPVRDSDELLETIRSAALAGPDAEIGVMHVANERGNRGGFSVYVPEYWDGSRSWPLVVALHGGSGHGRDFLWTWLREARSRGFLLLSPTSRDRTWSIIEPQDVDAEPLRSMVAHVAQRWNADAKRILLTGMSDGATYALLAGLREGVPYTHLAPLSGVLHPLAHLPAAIGKPIYLVHGALDWMFPVSVARMGRDQLTAAGAALEYRELEDLSHTYARDENPRILRWFDPGLALPGEEVEAL